MTKKTAAKSNKSKSPKKSAATKSGSLAKPSEKPPSYEANPSATPHVSVNAQYIKDFSFENPNAPRSLSLKTQPKIDVNVDLRAQPLSVERGLFEVMIKLQAKATNEGAVSFLVELSYGAVFTLTNIPPQDIEKTLLVYCPNLIFPFARQVIASATRDGGFPPLLLEPIDFGSLYLQRRRAASN